MDQVKKLIRAGASIPTAVKEALALNGLPSVQAFANKHDLDRSRVASHFNGGARPDEGTLSALSLELGGTVDEWRELLWLAGKPKSAV
jgi:hypothetical protein